MGPSQALVFQWLATLAMYRSHMGTLKNTHQIYFPGSLGALDRFRDLADSQDSSVCCKKFPTNTFQETHEPKPFPGLCLAETQKDHEK